MKPYLSVQGEATSERVIEKSRFLSYAAHVESEEEAQAFLARLRGEHPLATHICYAFVADRLGNLIRFSDAGEPQGTAGMPILGVIRAKKLFETAVAVVRYFGGIKLGAGGLTRAYAASAQDALSVAPVREYDECIVFSATVSYSEVSAVLRVAEAEGLPYTGNFGEAAEFVLTVREREKEGVFARLTDITNGRIALKELERRIAPFPVAE